jgi:hypothetical protein
MPYEARSTNGPFWKVVNGRSLRGHFLSAPYKKQVPIRYQPKAKDPSKRGCDISGKMSLWATPKPRPLHELNGPSVVRRAN